MNLKRIDYNGLPAVIIEPTQEDVDAFISYCKEKGVVK